MAFTVAARNAAVDALTALGTYVSLHSGDPGSDGAHEVAGTTRQQTTWGTSAAGVADGSQVAFTDAPPSVYSHYAIWTAASGGTYRWGFALSPGVTLSGDSGTVLVTPHLAMP